MGGVLTSEQHSFLKINKVVQGASSEVDKKQEK